MQQNEVYKKNPHNTNPQHGANIMHTDTMKQKSLDALHYIIKDAGEAARAMATMGNYQAECKYLDQVNDACTELHRRKTARGK